MTEDRNARIRERAYHLWLEEGRPHGRHDEHWRRAEREVTEEEGDRRDGPRVTGSREGAETSGAPAASVGKAARLRADDRQDPVAAEPAGASRSRAGSPTPDQPEAQPEAKPRARRSRPAADGSGPRGSRRAASAKPAE